MVFKYLPSSNPGKSFSLAKRSALAVLLAIDGGTLWVDVVLWVELPPTELLLPVTIGIMMGCPPSCIRLRCSETGDAAKVDSTEHVHLKVLRCIP